LEQEDWELEKRTKPKALEVKLYNKRIESLKNEQAIGPRTNKKTMSLRNRTTTKRPKA
jgi:hypothetical protein